MAATQREGDRGCAQPCALKLAARDGQGRISNADRSPARRVSLTRTGASTGSGARDIAQRRQQVWLVHRHAAEPALPEMPGAPLARKHASGTGAVLFGERGAMVLEEVAAGGISASPNNVRCRPVPRGVTGWGNTGDHVSSQARHGRKLAHRTDRGNLAHCHRNLVIWSRGACGDRDPAAHRSTAGTGTMDCAARAGYGPQAGPATAGAEGEGAG